MATLAQPINQNASQMSNKARIYALLKLESQQHCFTGEEVVEGKFQGRSFCPYLIGTLYATTNLRELVPEEGRLLFFLPDGIRNVRSEWCERTNVASNRVAC